MENYQIELNYNPEPVKRAFKNTRKQLKKMPRYILDIFSELVEDNAGDVIKPFGGVGRWLKVRHKSQRLKKYQAKRASKGL